MSDSDDPFAEVREESTFGTRDDDIDPYRKQREQTTSSEKNEESNPVEELVESLESVRKDNKTPSIGCRDSTFAAYLDYLYDNPERMRSVGEALIEKLESESDVNPPEVNVEEKSGIIRLLIRVAVLEVVPEDFELISLARGEYGRRNP